MASYAKYFLGPIAPKNMRENARVADLINKDTKG
jgi:hypothetical protein